MIGGAELVDSDGASAQDEATDDAEHATEQGGTAVSQDWQPAAPTGQWFDFPHTSLFYMKAAEDESHVYFLQTHTDGVIGSLYRMDRDGSNLVYIIGDEPRQGVYCLHSRYYRVPKTGGEAEFLFEQEHSYMQAYEGQLHFLFMRQLSMGIYKPGTDTAPRLIPLFEWDDSDPADPPNPLSEFSIYDGYLYDADTWEMARGYYRMDLATMERSCCCPAWASRNLPCAMLPMTGIAAIIAISTTP